MTGLWLLCVGLVLSGCDTSVDAFETAEQPFSIVGVLDAGLDTQFVRVAAVDDSMAFGGPRAPLGATVETEHLGSGRTTVWRDSLFRMRLVRGEEGEQIRWVHNFWTTEPFEPTETYRFTVTGADGRSSTATVTLPDTLSGEFIIDPPGGVLLPWRILVPGAERLADAIVVLHEQMPSGRERRSEFSVVADTMRPAAGGLIVRIYSSEIRERTHGGQVRGWVRIVTAGPDWPESGGLDDEMLLTPGIVSNVEKGYGYLGGVVSQTRLLCGAGTPYRCR